MVCMNLHTIKSNSKEVVSDHVKILLRLAIRKTEQRERRLSRARLINEIVQSRERQINCNRDWAKITAFGDLSVSIFIIVWFLQFFFLPSTTSTQHGDMDYILVMCLAGFMGLMAILLKESIRKNWEMGIKIWASLNMAVVFTWCALGIVASIWDESRFLPPSILVAAFYKSFQLWTVGEFLREMKPKNSCQYWSTVV